MANATQLPPELIPGNIAEIEEKARQRQEQWDKKLEELTSLRTPTDSTRPLPWLIPVLAGLGIGLLAGVAIAFTLTGVLA